MDPIPANDLQIGAILIPSSPIVVEGLGGSGGEAVPQTHAVASLTG